MVRLACLYLCFCLNGSIYTILVKKWMIFGVLQTFPKAIESACGAECICFIVQSDKKYPNY